MRSATTVLARLVMLTFLLLVPLRAGAQDPTREEGTPPPAETAPTPPSPSPAALLPPPPPPPAPPAVEATERKWWQTISFNAFASLAYQYNFNDPPSGTTQFRSFDYQHNSFMVHGVELVVQKPVEKKGDFGFRLDFTYGNIARGSTARGLFRDPATGQSQDIDLQQAYGSYIIPIGRGLRLDIGKFVTIVGAELIPGYDGWNDHFSHSWLFTYGPFTHTGLKLTYSFHDWFAVTAALLNGWDNVIDNNKAKSFGVIFSFTPHPMFALNAGYMGGPERDNNDVDFRHLVDIVATVKPHKRITLMLNVDYGRDQNAVSVLAPDGSLLSTYDASWMMAVLYFRGQVHDRVGLSLRGELFIDFDGNRTGTAQTLWSITFTPEFKITDAFYVRAEGRFDQSDTHVFEIPNMGLRRYQPTVAVNAFYIF
jgi:hypothetical protein